MDIIGKLQNEIKAKSTIDEDGCWVWDRSVHNNGYGSFTLKDRTQDVKDFFPNNRRAIGAHKASFLVFRHEIPEGQSVMHRCTKRHCVNPNHLYLGSRLDVTAKIIREGKKLNKSKFRSKPKDIKNDIRARLLNGESFTSIGKRYGMTASSIRWYAPSLEKQRGKKLSQRLNVDE